MITEVTVLIHHSNKMQAEDIADQVVEFAFDLTANLEMDVSAVAETRKGSK